MSVPHILYLSHEGLTDPLGQSQVLAYVRELAQHGFRFTVVCAEKKQNLSIHAVAVEANLAGRPVAWHWVNYRNRPPLLGPWWTLKQLETQARRIGHRDPPQLIHCRSLLMARLGARLAQRLRCPWLFDMRGFWADERAESGLWPPTHPIYGRLYRYFQAEERRLERQAPHIVTLTERARTLILDRTGRPTTSVTVIPCCVDQDWMQETISPAQIQSLRTELDVPPGQLVIGYLGSLGGWYQVEEMFACVATWYERQTLAFLVVTTDPPERVYRLASQAGLKSEALRVRAAKRSEVPALVQLMDVGLFFIRPCYSKQASSPTKLAEFLAAGKPIVTRAGVGDLDLQLANQPFALVLAETNRQAYEQAYEALPRLLQADPTAARRLAAEYYSLALGVARYQKIYQALLE